MKGKSARFLAALVFLIASHIAHADWGKPAKALGPLRVHPTNPRYFADPQGRAVYLTGSHTWQSLQDGILAGYTTVTQPFDYTEYLNLLQANHHNFIRLWRWELTTHEPQPWQRTGPGLGLDGKPKFDLKQFNQAYFDRLRARVIAAQDRGIYVSIMLFEDWIFMAKRKEHPVEQHPFHKGNNVSGIDGDPNGDGWAIEIHTLQVPEVLEVQKAYVRKVIETVNDLDNVLYEICNEGMRHTRDWQYEMVRFIKSVEAKMPKQHPVGMTSVGNMNDDCLKSPADWTSLATTGWDRPKDPWTSDPPAADGHKVCLLDTDHIGWKIFIDDAAFTRAWVWKSFTRGHNTLLMENLADSAGWIAGRAAMGHTRRLAERMNLAMLAPHPGLASTRYCLAEPGKEYVIYLPAGGEATVDLSAATGPLSVEWVHPSQGTITGAESVAGGDKRTLKAPFRGDAVVHLQTRMKTGVTDTINTAPYLAAVRQFADQVLAHGRDTYGKPTPLFVDGLNADTLEPVKWKWADGKEWVLCNLTSQQGLFRTLDGLSRLTGEPRYKEAALEALRYAFDHLRYGTEHNGGLLAWGGHLAYNATDDVIAGHPNGTGRTHELKCFFPHYELMWEANPQATRQIIENMWDGHVLDWAILDFNRHASPKKPGLLWQNGYRGGEVFFDGKGLTFHNAGSDFYFAAGMLSKLSSTPEPLVWAKRLAHRYVETRDPKTGLGGYQFSQCLSAWCDDVGRIRGDRAQYQYGDDFKGHRVVEGTLFPCYGDTPEVEPEVGGLLLGDQLGDAGRDFTRWVVEELTAWGKSAYRKKDNTFIPMLTDGTSMEGYVCKKDGYFGPKGRVLRAGHPGPAHFWVYAWAFRQSRDAFLWEMTRNISQGNGWGDIGETPQAGPALRFPKNAADPYLLFGLLELHRAGGNVAFLDQAQTIGQNILKERVQQGWFVSSKRHLFCRLSNNESQALLHLAAALAGKPESVPAFTGAAPFFHAEYGGRPGREYDSATIYGRTRK